MLTGGPGGAAPAAARGLDVARARRVPTNGCVMEKMAGATELAAPEESSTTYIMGSKWPPCSCDSCVQKDALCAGVRTVVEVLQREVYRSRRLCSRHLLHEREHVEFVHGAK